MSDFCNPNWPNFNTVSQETGETYNNKGKAGNNKENWPKYDRDMEVSKCCWDNESNSLASIQGCHNLQFVKYAISVKCSEMR